MYFAKATVCMSAYRQTHTHTCTHVVLYLEGIQLVVLGQQVAYVLQLLLPQCIKFRKLGSIHVPLILRLVLHTKKVNGSLTAVLTAPALSCFSSVYFPSLPYFLLLGFIQSFCYVFIS